MNNETSVLPMDRTEQLVASETRSIDSIQNFIEKIRNVLIEIIETIPTISGLSELVNNLPNQNDFSDVRKWSISILNTIDTFTQDSVSEENIQTLETAVAPLLLQLLIIIDSPEISDEDLKVHYAEYATRSNERVEIRAKVKKAILEKVFFETHFQRTDKTRISVFGASDKRYLPVHKRLFEETLKTEVDMTTFDIDTEHLVGESNIKQHDVRQPLREEHSDIIFAHALLKFINISEQFTVIENSYKALIKGGLAINICHRPEFREISKC
jgi:hypothetical protein